jgi:hypothetical protein
VRGEGRDDVVTSWRAERAGALPRTHLKGSVVLAPGARLARRDPGRRGPRRGCLPRWLDTRLWRPRPGGRDPGEVGVHLGRHRQRHAGDRTATHGRGGRTRRRCDVATTSARGSASSGLSRRGAVNAATRDVEPPDAVGLFAGPEGEQRGTGRHVSGHVAALGRSREHRYRRGQHRRRSARVREAGWGACRTGREPQGPSGYPRSGGLGRGRATAGLSAVAVTLRAPGGLTARRDRGAYAA